MSEQAFIELLFSSKIGFEMKAVHGSLYIHRGLTSYLNTLQAPESCQSKGQSAPVMPLNRFFLGILGPLLLVESAQSQGLGRLRTQADWSVGEERDTKPLIRGKVNKYQTIQQSKTRTKPPPQIKPNLSSNQAKPQV